MRMVVSFVFVVLLVACGAPPPSVPIGRDAGERDASAPDAGEALDGGDREDGAPAEDAGQDDGGNVDDGGADLEDASDDRDAALPDSGPCEAPVCAAPPAGCAWEGATDCHCGTLRCDLACEGGCGSDEYCEVAGEGACAGSGSCRTRPAACDLVWEPVCGCDGRTHQNECWAASEGTDVAFAGECPVSTDCRVLGCPAGDVCDVCSGRHLCTSPGTPC